MPRKRSTPKLLHRAMELRHQATPAEKQLWARLRLMRKEEGIHFRRQHAIDKYITDFCSPRKKLVIELDGSQHGGASDIGRTIYLESRGYRVLRFWNEQVLKDIEGVLSIIYRVLEA